ncbi:MAG TPA: hypothetical protein VGJ98_07775 [Candidatus Eisenbacteria bacterium]
MNGRTRKRWGLLRAVSTRRISILILSTALGGVSLGCTAAKEFAALRRVEFRFDGITGARVAGIPLRNIRSYSDLTAVDLGRVGIAIARGDVPLDLTVHVEGRNPESNDVTARLLRLGWAYLVDDREVVTGRLTEAYTFPPGEPRDVPLLVTFNLMDVFGDQRQDLIDIALALAGQRSSTHKITLRLDPTVETPVGPIRYPIPITLDLSSPATR